MKLRRRELSQTIFNVVGLLVILSMVLGGLLVTIVPPSRPTPTPFPTRLRPTPTPTGTPSPSATVTPTTTPSPSATPRATSRPTDSPTASFAPTNTPLPSATVTSTITPTVTPTTTPAAGAPATPIPLGSRDIENFTFAVCGDSRSGQAIYQEILRRVEEDGAAFLVNTGDLVEFGQASEFQALARSMSDFSLPFYPVPGNHDTSDGSLDEFIRYSGAPAAHYSFDYGLGHFVIADSHMGFMSPRELDWLEVDLAATDRPLKMVFVHHPPFDPDGTNYTMGRGYDTFMALMEEYAVSYVFAGHIHAYAEETRNGVHYIITGGAGAPLYTSGHPQAFYHYVRVTVNGTDVSTEVVRIQP